MKKAPKKLKNQEIALVRKMLKKYNRNKSIEENESILQKILKDHDKKSVIEEPKPISLEAEQLRTFVKQFLEKGSFDNPPEPPRYYGKVDDTPFKGKRSEYKIFDSKP
jgi:hypothetical protein